MASPRKGALDVRRQHYADIGIGIVHVVLDALAVHQRTAEHVGTQAQVGTEIEAPAGLLAGQVQVVVTVSAHLYLAQDAGELHVPPVIAWR
jgi:hypothetical protein